MSTQITLSEAAKRLKVSEKSIRRYIKSGRLEARLIKGQKGYEYRIDVGELKILEKPPRGKNSHKDKKIKNQKNKKLIKKKIIKKVKPVKPLESVGEIIKKRIKTGSIAETAKPASLSSGSDANLIDYKTLYENLLAKYEQTLLMLGALESQVLNRSNPANNAKVEKMEDSIAKQEEIIMDLYQTIQLYKNENNY
jgi:hypothetical protein